RAVLGSLTLSLASTGLSLGTLFTFVAMSHPHPSKPLWLIIPIYFVVGGWSLWIVARGRLWLMLASDLTVLLVPLAMFLFLGQPAWRTSIQRASAWGLYGALLLSLVSDIAFVAATRWLLRVTQSVKSAMVITSLILLNIAAAAILIGVPLVVVLTRK